MNTNPWDKIAGDLFDTSDEAKLHASSADNILIAHPAIINIVNAHFGALKNIDVLDFGCGTGGFTQELANMGMMVTGIDQSPKMIQLARLRNIPNVNFINGDVEDIVFNTSFDMIVSVMVLQFIEQAEIFLDRLCQHLRKNGLLIIVAHNPKYIEECLKRKYKFERMGMQLHIDFSGKVRIRMFERTLADYENMLDPKYKVKRHAIVEPPFTNEYILKYAQNSKEPTHVSKYLIMAFKK